LIVATLVAPPVATITAVPRRADRLGSLIIAALGIAITIAFALQAMVTLVGGVLLCLLFVIYYRRVLVIDARTATRAVIVLVLFAPAFFKPGHGVSPIFYLFSTAVSFTTAAVISRFSAATIHRAATIIYWVLASIVGGILLFYWGTPEPFGEVIQGSSTNGIPAYMIVIQLFLCVTTFVMTGRAPVLTPALTFVIAFFGNGRGSLVVGSLLVLGSLIINLFPRSVSFKYRIALFVISIVALFELSIHATDLYDYVSRFTKLSVGIEDRNRARILSDYLAQINPYTFFFGAEYEGTIIDIQYKGNPHISFIRTHSFFGIFALLMALLSPFVVLFSRGRWSLKLPIFFFVALAVVRAGSEPILFPTLLDVFYFAMIMIYFRARNAGEAHA
jgi:hypothetical protein